MYIKLSPVRADRPREVIRVGDTLIVDGEPYDFGIVKEGDILPLDAVGGGWLISDVERCDGALHLTMILPHGSAAPQETLFPSSLHLTEDGPVALPDYGDDQ